MTGYVNMQPCSYDGYSCTSPSSSSSSPSLLSLITFIPNSSILQRNHTHTITLSHLLGITQLYTVNVKHCYEAYGICIEHAMGWKVVYSGNNT